jgi:hypothetical protein
MCCLFLAWIAGMGGERMIESLAIDVLAMRGQVPLDGERQIFIRGIWQTFLHHGSHHHDAVSTLVFAEKQIAEEDQPMSSVATD